MLLATEVYLKMKIGIVAPFNPHSVLKYFGPDAKVPDVNRNASSINAIVEELLEQGHRVIVFTYVTDHRFIPQVVEGEQIKVYVLSSKTIIPKAGLFVRLYMPRALRNVMDNEVKNLDVLHAHWTYDYALAAQNYCDRLPVFVTVRDWCPKILRQQRSPLQIIYWILSWFVYKRVMRNEKTHFIANSYYTENMLRNTYPSKKINLNFNPINKSYILSERRYKPDGLVFISIADSLSNPGKNIITLLKAFKQFREQHSDASLILVGKGGEEGASFRVQCEELGLNEGVEFRGFVSHDKLLDIIDRATCLVHPSLEETFGNTLLEAMSRCVLVIGGQYAGAVPHVLEHGEIGVLCDVKDPGSICNAMTSVLNEDLQRRITSKATKKLKELYSSDQVARQLINIYKQYD